MKLLKNYSVFFAFPLLMMGMVLSSCSKQDKMADSSQVIGKKIINNFPNTHGPIQIPIKISSYAGPCIATGGWCVDMPIPSGNDPFLQGHAMSRLGYDPANPADMLIYFDAYYEGENLNGISNYEVEANHNLPAEASMNLRGVPNTTVLKGSYPLGTSADGSRFVIVSITNP
ncbi:MAG: hypothetical protein RLP14_04035 [Owenweeksia sp.]